MTRSDRSHRAVAGRERVAAGLPFAILGTIAILAGGLTAAAIAHQPTRELVWMVAYLVLVVGAMQVVIGVGQAWLAERAPDMRGVGAQWAVFNAGNMGVIAGTLGHRTGLVAIGTVLFAIAIGWFLHGVRRCRQPGWAVAYRILLGFVLASAFVGLALSALSNGAQ